MAVCSKIDIFARMGPPLKYHRLTYSVIMSCQVDLSDDEVKKVIAILRFAKDACPVESISGNIDDDAVEDLISKFEKSLAA